MDIFIISGQIPGTNYQLTFTDLVAFCILAPMIYLALVERRSIKAKLLQLRLRQFKPKLSE